MEQSVQHSKQHAVNLTDRNNGSVSGVEKVLSVSPELISVSTSLGDMTVGGKNLEVNSFSEKDGALSFTGNVDEIRYVRKKEPLLKRLFK